MLLSGPSNPNSIEQSVGVRSKSHYTCEFAECLIHYLSMRGNYVLVFRGLLTQIFI
jgi:hypothetical protein